MPKSENLWLRQHYVASGQHLSIRLLWYHFTHYWKLVPGTYCKRRLPEDHWLVRRMDEVFAYLPKKVLLG